MLSLPALAEAPEVREVRVAVEKAYAPFVFVGRDGTPQGIAIDYLRLLEREPGLRFALGTTGELAPLLAQIRDRQVDLHPALTATPERAAFLRFTAPYFSVPAVVVTRRDHLLPGPLEPSSSTRVAVGEGYAVEEFLRQRLPGLLLVRAPDDEACLRLVASGSVEAAVVDLASASYIISSTGLQGLQVGANVGFSYELAMAVRADQPELQALLDARLRHLDPRDVEHVRDTWLRLAPAETGSRAFWLGLFATLSVGLLLATGAFGVNWALRTTVRRRTHELAASEARFRALIERSSDLTLVVDPQGGITFASPAAMQLLGRTPEALLGRRLLSLVHPDDVASLAVLMEVSPGALSRLNRVELRLQRQDGTWAQLESEARNLVVVPGVRGVVLNSRDLSERNRFREQLLQSQKLESIGRLAGGVAHDFNNLLTVILTCGEELGAAAQARESVDPVLVDDLLHASRRAAELTAQLLAFARKQLVAPVVLDLDTLVRDSEKLLGRLLGEDVRVVHVACDGPGHVRCDAGLLGQLIMNLAVNARDAMPRGGTLTLAVSNVEFSPGAARPDPEMPSGSWVRLRVADTGAGMPAEVLAHCFEPFFTTKGAGRGTGLGLATVHGIVKQSGAFITVRSLAGQGTTFDVYFARAQGEPLTLVAPVSGVGARGDETVLVVEDEPRVREVAVRALTAAGYRVLEASSGEEALRVFSGEPGPVDLLVSDVVMGGMSGRELSQRLVAVRPALRVLFVSGYSDETISRHGVLDEGVSLLPKPFTPEVLRRRVREVLDRPGVVGQRGVLNAG